eukprot:432058-Pelagomonas_calceolata.AAC.3
MQVVAKDMALTSANARYHEAASQLADKQQELENNAGAETIVPHKYLFLDMQCARSQPLHLIGTI